MRGAAGRTGGVAKGGRGKRWGSGVGTGVPATGAGRWEGQERVK